MEWHLHDQEALVERLVAEARRETREVTSLVGSPLTQPLRDGAPGVPGVWGMHYH